MSVKSMTGYGRASTVLDGKEISIDIKSVNHRYFDFNAKIHKDYLFLEDKVKSAVNTRISRGKVDVFLFFDIKDNSQYEIIINKELADGYANAFKTLGKYLKIKNDVSTTFFARVPDILQFKKKSIDEQEIEESVMKTLEDALDSFDSMRIKEGEKLYNYILTNLDIILDTVDKIEKLAPESIQTYRDRLSQKMTEALEGKDYDEQRLITEVAIFADKIDVGEETVRLKSHISQFKELMECSSNAIGKKLDFIVQEMNREINTIGSKCNSIEITRLVVDTKSVIEKIREQIQNIE